MAHYPESLLRRVQKPIRYLGGEYNAIRKDPAAVTSRVALVFPDTYEIGMSHWGSRLLYHLLNADPMVAAERFYCPWPDMEAELRARSLPLVSLENGIPLADFHLIGISLLYELTFSNILTILDLGGIPLRAGDRRIEHPLVVGGGPAASNPEPVADFFDLILLGEGEEAFPEIIRREAEIRGEKNSGLERREYLRRFTGIEGVYVPSLYPTTICGPFMVVDQHLAAQESLPVPIRRRWPREVDAFPLPEALVVPNTEIVHDRVTAEISRGCPQTCRFCHATFFYRPVRERRVGELVRWILGAVGKTGYEEVSLASLSSGAFGGVEDLAELLSARLRGNRVGLSLPSLRASELSTRLAEAIAEIRKTGFTVAPEAGSQRLRDVINKNLTEEEICQGILAAYRCGWDLIKLYFMIGLPFETDDDVSEIVALTGRILGRVRAEPDYHRRRRKFQINLAVSSFIPKAHTPFQWAPMNSAAELRRKLRAIKDRLRDRTISLKWHDAGMSRMEGVLSRGDRRLADVLVHAWRLGVRFDGWGERFEPRLWEEAFAAAALDPEHYFQPVTPGTVLPWSHLNLGVREEFLRRQWAAAARAECTPACDWTPAAEPEDPGNETQCQACGLGCRPDELAGRRRQNRIALETIRREPAPARPEPPPAFHTYRLAFTKTGPAAWMSHLDLVRTLPRIFRRANLPLKFTEGFHPRPQLAFSPALGVGVHGRREFVDVPLAGEPERALDWLRAVNRVSVPGIEFTGIDCLPENAPAIIEQAPLAGYRIVLPPADARRYRVEHPAGLPVLPSGTDVEERPGPTITAGESWAWLSAGITDRMRQTEWIVVREQAGKQPRRRDLRPFLVDAGAIVTADAIELRFTARLTPQGSIRPDEWLTLCLPGYTGEFSAERLWLGEAPPAEPVSE